MCVCSKLAPGYTDKMKGRGFSLKRLSSHPERMQTPHYHPLKHTLSIHFFRNNTAELKKCSESPNN